MAASLIVSDALRSLPLGGWLVPWPGTRGTVVLHSIVGLIIEQAFTYGHVDVLQQTTAQTPDGGIPVGAAMWVHCPGETPLARPMLRRPVGDNSGPADRFAPEPRTSVRTAQPPIRLT